MITEELLKPRYKKIADWPNSNIKVGEICTIVDDFGKFGQFNSHHPIHYKVMEYHPHLFKKLEWWEERKLEDMPEYYKINVNGCSLDKNAVFKSVANGIYNPTTEIWGNGGDFYATAVIEESTDIHDTGEHVTINVKNLLPATLTDYLTYKQSNQ